MYKSQNYGNFFSTSNSYNNNVQWVRKQDRFGRSVFVPLVVGGALGYVFGQNSNNNTYCPWCYTPVMPYYPYPYNTNNNYYF